MQKSVKFKRLIRTTPGSFIFVRKSLGASFEYEMGDMRQKKNTEDAPMFGL